MFISDDECKMLQELVDAKLRYDSIEMYNWISKTKGLLRLILERKVAQQENKETGRGSNV